MSQFASEEYGGKKKKASLSTLQSKRPQRLMLHLWGCSGVSWRPGRTGLTADINIYVFLNLLISSFQYSCTIFPDGLTRPLTVIQNPEELSKSTRKKKSDESVRLKSMDGRILFVSLPHLSPLKKCYTCWSKHTHTVPPSHGQRGESALCQLLSFVVKRVNDFAHILNCFQGCFVCFVHWRLFKND